MKAVNSADVKMRRFQELMLEFLETQQQIMSTYLEHTGARKRGTKLDPATGPFVPAAGREMTAAGEEYTPSADWSNVAQATRARAAEDWRVPASSTEAAPDERPVDVQIDMLLPPRFVVRASDLAAPTARQLWSDGVVLVTDDGSGLADALETTLRLEGQRVVIVSPVTAAGGQRGGRLVAEFATPEDVQRVVDQVKAEHGAISAVVHLLPLRTAFEIETLPVSAWASRAAIDVRTLFLLAQAVRADLEEAAGRGGAALIAVTGMGGTFASDPAVRPTSFFPGQGAVTGLLKTLALEWPTVRVRTLDLDLDDGCDQMAAHVMTELRADDDVTEVGYTAGRRMTLRPVPQRCAGASGLTPDSEWIWLVTGGARGITADGCLALAERSRPTFLVVGRTAVPSAVEAEETAGIDAPQQLKAVLLEHLRRERQTVTPALVEEAYTRVMREREMRTNLAALAETGARVRYYPVDVKDEHAFGSLIEDIYHSYGRIDGVIHGAGIIQDKLLKDKSPESFDRVFRTKVDSAFVLARHLRPESLQVLVLFSSVAGRFGNRGQGDYGAANEVLNKLAIHLDQRWPARVVALNWGPWDKRGMVSPEVKREFARRGIALISPNEGRRTLIEEITSAPKGDAEVVIGNGPWASL